MVVDVDGDELARLGLADTDEEARIRLLVDALVGLARGANDMAEHLARPVIGIQPDVEQRRPVIGPHGAAARLGDLVGKILAGMRVTNAEGEELGARLVARPRDQLVIGRMVDTGQAEIGLVPGQLVGVQKNGFFAPFARGAHDLGMLSALDIAGRVGVGAVGCRNGGIVLLDAALQLLKQRFLQRLGRCHRCIRICVLRLQIGPDLRIQRGGLAHHLLPIVRPQPGVVVRFGDAVMNGGGGALLRARGRIDLGHDRGGNPASRQ